MSLGDRLCYPRLDVTDHLYGGLTGSMRQGVYTPSNPRQEPSVLPAAGAPSPAPLFAPDPPRSPGDSWRSPHTPTGYVDEEGWETESQANFRHPSKTAPVKRHNDRYYTHMSGLGTASKRTLYPPSPVGKSARGLGNQTNLQVPVSPFYRFCH